MAEPTKRDPVRDDDRIVVRHDGDGPVADLLALTFLGIPVRLDPAMRQDRVRIEYTAPDGGLWHIDIVNVGKSVLDP